MMNYYFFLDACTNSGVLKTILFVENLLKIVFYMVPILLVLMVTIDLSKAVLSSDESAMQKSLKIVIKRMVSVIVLFLVPTISEVAVNLASDTAWSDYTLCLTNTENISYYETLDAQKKKIEEEKTQKWYASLDADATYKKSVWKLSKDQGTSGSSSSGETHIGQTYQLTDSQLTELANYAYGEQGSADGSAAEITLLANRFEMYGSSYGSGADGMLNYLKDGGWFASWNGNVADQTAKDAVKKVLTSGQRTLPLYVDEHDCWYCNSKNYCSNGNMGDICTVDDNASKDYITNRSNYVQDKNVIKNVYGSTYTFYTFPSSDSDPFGYTQESYNKIKGSNK